MTKTQLHKFLSRFHKVAALVIGIQLILWTSGGFIMTYLPIEEVRSEHLIAEQAPSALQISKLQPISNYSDLGPFKNIQILTMAGKAVYKFTPLEGDDILLDALSGEKLSPISEKFARQIVQADYGGKGEILHIKLLQKTDIEYRGPLPVWAATFDTDNHMMIYLSPITGKILARRSDTWRLFDFMWMLHIMDYDTRDNFNNPMVVIFSFFAVIFLLSGVGLLFFRLQRRDLGLKRSKIK